MTPNAFGLVHRHAVGCTFAEWSIMYLSGQPNVTDNPLTANNSHRYKKNNMHDSADVEAVLDALPINSSLTCVYFCPTTLDESNNLHHCGNQFSSRKLPLIQIKLSKEYSLWSNFNRGKPGAPLRIHNSDDVNALSDIQLRREQILLGNEFLKLWWHDTPIGYGLSIESRDYWFQTEDTIRSMMQYLGLKVVTAKLDQWRTVLTKWHEPIHNLAHFCITAEDISDSIVYCEDREINLTDDQSLIVQHILLFKHKLLLKNYNTFPTNTKDVHVLLEANIHKFNRIQLDYIHSVGYSNYNSEHLLNTTRSRR
jgi:hypothetical protein